MNRISCPNCGQPVKLLGHQCPYCHIQIVGASGLSRLVREAGNTPYLAAGGLFMMAFFLCILIFWKTGMMDSSQLAAQYPASSKDTSFLGLGGISGKWSGRFLNNSSETGNADLNVKEAGSSLTGTWNGSSITKGKREQENQLFWEYSQAGRVWKFSAHVHESSHLLTVSHQSLTQEGATQSGVAFLFREGADQGSTPDAAALGGSWSGLYSLGPKTGISTISVQEDKSGALSGVWNGNARITEGSRSGRFLQWECEQGETHFQNIGAIIGDGKKLVLIYRGTEKTDEVPYCGAALYSKNP